MFKDTKAFSGFAVQDMAAARAFYGDTLGIETRDEAPMLMTLHLAGDRPTLVYEQPGCTPASYTILNFQVDDVGRAVDELRSRGVEMERYEGMNQDERGVAHNEGPLIAWFKDPSGNVLSVIEPG